MTRLTIELMTTKSAQKKETTQNQIIEYTNKPYIMNRNEKNMEKAETQQQIHRVKVKNRHFLTRQ